MMMMDKLGRELKAFRIDEYDWYAHYSFDEAVEFASQYTGVPKDEIVDDMFATGEAENGDTEIWADEEMTRKIKISDHLKTFTEPAWCFGIET